VIPDRAEYASAITRGAERMRVAGTRVLVAARRDLDAERRVRDRLTPAVRLAATRQLAGDLLDRATRAVRVRLANAATAEERLADALPNLASRLLRERRAAIGAAAAALAVLGPQATLERGYAIVRKAADEAIVRDPIEVSAGSRLRVRVARGEFPATAGETSVNSKPGSKPGPTIDS
jgi:exodeoxyribonuclease VII large subunit